jgi:hypothetical protein
MCAAHFDLTQRHDCGVVQEYRRDGYSRRVIACGGLPPGNSAEDLKRGEVVNGFSPQALLCDRTSATETDLHIRVSGVRPKFRYIW